MTKVITLSGYYGFHNAGDDAVCHAILASLARHIPAAERVVLSNDPEDTAKRFGVRAVNRWQPADILSTLAFSDLLISGGGSLLQDVTSRNGILYYLGILEAAHRLGIPTLVYAQGIGPITRPRNQWLTARALNQATMVTVRDAASKTFLASIGVKKPVLLAADPVLSVPKDALHPERGRQLLRRAGWDGERPVVLAALRPWEEEDRVPLFAAAFDQVVRAGYEVVFLAMQHTKDAALCTAVAGHMEERVGLLTEGYDPATLFDLFSVAHMVAGMRLHALIMGAVCGCRLMGISYDPKIDAFMEQVQAPFLLPLRDLQLAPLTESLLKAVAGTPPEERRVAYLARLGEVPARLAAAMI